MGRRRHLRCQKREVKLSSTRDSVHTVININNGHQSRKIEDRSYLVVRERFADVARGRLSIVRILWMYEQIN